MKLIAHPHILVRATSERFLPAGATFRVGLASENHWLQPILDQVLNVRWWPAPVCVGGLLVVGSSGNALSLSIVMLFLTEASSLAIFPMFFFAIGPSSLVYLIFIYFFFWGGGGVLSPLDCKNPCYFHNLPHGYNNLQGDSIVMLHNDTVTLSYMVPNDYMKPHGYILLRV